MPATNTLEGRIRLKMDTEENWNANPIVPLAGELIIYSADSTHSYSRLKVGDGSSSVTALPFIDAGTIQGSELPDGSVYTFPNRSSFPYPGVPNSLYIDLSKNIIYCYTSTGGYAQLSNFTYSVERTQVSNITYWRTGVQPTFNAEGGILKVTTGVLPSLNYETISVVRNISKEVEE